MNIQPKLSVKVPFQLDSYLQYKINGRHSAFHTNTGTETRDFRLPHNIYIKLFMLLLCDVMLAQVSHAGNVKERTTVIPL